MKKVLIKNLSGGVINWFQSDHPEQIILQCEQNNYWGLPERPELDEEGNPTGNMLPAEYTIEIQDISAQVALENCMAARRAEYPTAEEFLNAFFDGGDAAVAELQAKRLAIKQKYPKP